METKQAYDAYVIAKNSIMMDTVTLESIQVNKETEELEGDYINEISLGKRTEYINENEMDGYLKVELLCKKKESNDIELKLEVIHRGRFLSGNVIDRSKFEDWTEIQVVPQLLPYARSIITNITSHMGIPPITLPTMDILESIKINRSRELEGED